MTDRLSILSEYIFEQKRNIAISGVGGCGKSHLIKQIYKAALDKNIKVALTSTTGVSSHNLGEGAKTIHSYLGVILPNYTPPDLETFLLSYSKKLLRKKKYAGRWKNIELLIIDEVSMLGGTYLEMLNYLSKLIRKNNQVFGGIQLIFSMDMLQLPPVKDVYAFETETWNDLHLQYVILNKAYRFASEEWVGLLKRARVGKMNSKDQQTLKECLRKDLPEKIQPTVIYSKKSNVEDMNIEKLRDLEGYSTSYDSFDEVEVNPESFLHPGSEDLLIRVCTKDQSAILNSCLNVGEKVELKIGAQVMLLSNLDTDMGLVNGSIGIVKGFEKDNVLVDFWKAGLHHIPYYVFTIETEDELLTRKAIPLRLAYSSTIHKVQSLSLDTVEIDIGNSIFSPNQAYVALSRCKSLEGLYISDLMISKIYPDKKALAFEHKIQKEAIQLE